MLEYHQVSKSFATQDGAELLALNNLTFNVAEGEFVAVVGPSGCGKSTLLNMTAGLYQPTEGKVLLSGVPVLKPNSSVGFMLQKDLLLPWRSVEANVAFGLEARGVSKSQRLKTANQRLEECHLANFSDYYPHQLSGGMRQRAALARTLAIEPEVILLDEPFSALDAQTRIVIQRNFAETIQQEGITTLLITHDLGEAVYMADRILVLSERPAVIASEINVDLPDRGNPTARRQNPDAIPIINHLFELLKLKDATEIA
ncbi:MAG: ABC transporter ATP-binding protein [Granulosicoccus sp.]|nr:ABC transporter ATP-binding protein [Granulosicoccus sp.]